MESRKNVGIEMIYIDNDLTWKIRREREAVLRKAKEMRRKEIMVKIGFNKGSNNEEEWILKV